MKTWLDPSLTYEDLATRLVLHLTRKPLWQARRTKAYYQAVNHMSQKTQRMLVAHLRHAMTDYETALRSFPTRERERARAALHESYNAAVLEAYPFLRPLTAEEVHDGRCPRHGGGNCMIARHEGLLYTDRSEASDLKTYIPRR